MNEELTKRIKSLKPSKGFTVTHLERVRVLQIAKFLKGEGIIKFDVMTRKDARGNFRVAAI